MSSDYIKALTNKKARKAAERYGVKVSDFGFSKLDGASTSKRRNPKDFGKAVANAAMNDYDTRRTIEAAAMSGKKKAEKYAKNGFKDLTDVTKANNMFAKMHKRQGNGGDFSSNSDYAGLTYNMVQRDRTKMLEGIAEDQKNSLASEEQANPKPEDLEPFDFEYSDKVQGAKDRIDEYELDVRSGKSIFNQDNNTPVAGDDQAAAADAFVDIYKADLLDAANLQENKAQNLNNAMDTVASYRSKFMR